MNPQLQLGEFLHEFDDEEVSQAYLNLYGDQQDFQRVFAWLHERYNNAFDFMNYKAPHGSKGHFNAEDSRRMMETNERLTDLQRLTDKSGKALHIDADYQRVIDSSREWLFPSYGSEIPKGLTPIRIEKYDSVFNIEDTSISIGSAKHAELHLIGAGSYATVHKFTDPEYGITFARKKLKKTVEEKERQRFRQEYSLMKQFDYPYILKVYGINESDNSYIMEYCEHTLKDFISHNNAKLRFEWRRKLAVQFLYAMNFLHNNGVMHRDLSYKNVLVHTYKNGGAFVIKVSDFGLAKTEYSELTSTGSAMKGSIKDPALSSFKDFRAVNDIYAIGFILNYIFTGRENLPEDDSPVSRVVQKCSASNPPPLSERERNHCRGQATAKSIPVKACRRL